MMYFKLALRNLKSTTKQYSVYFLTLIFGVILFYTFNSIGAQSVMLKMSEQQAVAFKSVDQMMGIVSIFLAFVLGFLIIYANKYMARRRSQEFSIYLTLGMRRSKLAWMLFIENFIIGVLSLVIGIIGGLFTSQLLAVLTSYMFKIQFNHFRFVFSAESCWKTVGLFLLIYLAVFLFNALSIRRLSIIDLMKVNQKAEARIKLPNFVYVLLFLASVLLLGAAYYTVWKLGVATISLQQMLSCIVAGIVGTILFFFATTNLLLICVKKLPKIYFRNLNPFVFRQISSEMTTSFLSLSVTCLLIFIAICMLAGGVGLNLAMTEGLELATPYEGSVQSPVNIQQEMKKNHIVLPKDQVKTAEVIVYNDDHVKATPFVRNKQNDSQLDQFYLFHANQPIPLVSLSQVNQSLRLAHKKEIHLESNQYLMTGTRLDVQYELNKDAKIRLNGRTLHSKDNKYHALGMYDVQFAMDPLVLVVPDQSLQQAKPAYYYLNLSFKNQKVADKLVQQFSQSAFAGGLLTRKVIIDQASVLGALASYLGIYIGFIFLMASAVLLAIQQLAKSDQDKQRYHLLAEIGATRRQRLAALRIQMMIFFGFPLVLALVHSIFGLHYATEVATSIGGISATPSILFAVTVIAIVYVGYFVLTYFNAKRNIE